MHPLVARQLRKAGIESATEDPRLAQFVAAVSAAYVAADDDRRQLERSLNLASEELYGRNRRLEAELERRAVMARHEGPQEPEFYRLPQHISRHADQGSAACEAFIRASRAPSTALQGGPSFA